MAEFGRWQWDDNGFWRDFGESAQTAMEAALKEKKSSCEISIHPFGVFIMDIQRMVQRAKSGRGAGFERKIRRQVKKISVAYFLLGEDCDMFESDSPVDQIEDLATLDKLVDLLSKILAEPEDFDRRSVNLAEDGNRETIGASPEAKEFLESRGFQLMEDVFMIFLHEQVEPLQAALTEVEAARGRLAKRKEGGGSLPSKQKQQATADVLPSNEAPSNQEPPEGNAKEARNLRQENGKNSKRRGGKLNDSPQQRKKDKVWRNNGRLWRMKDQGEDPEQLLALVSKEESRIDELDDQEQELIRAASIASQGLLEKLKQQEVATNAFQVQLVLRPGLCDLTLPEGGTLEELLEQVKAAKPGLRLPHLSVEGREGAERPLFGIAAEPGRSLKEFAHLNSGDKVVVEDFEVAFVERFQSGMLSLEDLAMVAPLLDWEKPELMRLLMDRMKMLLEDNDPAKDWCNSANVQIEDERRFGRALVCRLFKDKRLDERLEVCRKLLPVEQRAEAVLHVDRADFMTTAMDGLGKLAAKDLRGQLNVKFANEEGDDHGGPRRDFFVCFGERLASDLPGLWRRMGKGPLAPQPDDFSESTPASQRSNMDSEDAFRACGRAFGLAAKHGDVLGEDIAGFFLHQVCRDHVVTLEVLQDELRQCDEDNYLASDMIKTRSLEESGLKGAMLTRTITGTQKEVELIPGGKNVEVTEENKMEWLELHLQHKLYHCLQKACDAFREGLLDVLGGSRRTCPWLALVSPAELADVWAGHAVSEEGVERWRQVANIRPEVEEQATWFWNILREFDDDKRGNVLKFCTGAQRFPRAGLKYFEIQSADGGESSLPQARTCANMLMLPRYSCEDVLKQQLLKALEHSDEGFHFR